MHLQQGLINDPKSGPKQYVIEENNIYSILLDEEIMRQHYKYYSVETAEEIIRNLQSAWEKRRSFRTWGPSAIAYYSENAPETISRYLGAFKKAGIDEIDGIKIPHRFKDRIKPRQ